jgi:molybdate transport system substrate-binding protein
MGKLGRVLAVLALLASSVASAEEVAVYAAASLTDALKDVAKGFEAKTGNTLSFNFGASSDLARQIKAGAPADLFFSADAAQMDGLVAGGFVDPKDRVNVLSNILVVVVPSDSTAALTKAQDLPSVRHLSLADPQAVPAGVYAKGWLESIGLWDKVKDRVVPALNVRAALAAVEAGNAEAGIVYRTDAAISKRVKVAFEVAKDQGPAIVYPMARLSSSKKAATGALVQYLTSGEARKVYQHYGFLLLPE